MGYVIAGIIVLLIVAGFVTFLVMNSMRKGAGAGTADPSARQSDQGGPPGIGEDATPLGDTSEHAGEQTSEGTTADDPEGRGESAAQGMDPARPDRPEDRQLGNAGADTGVQPESERLADRPL
jgi:hypothetical protein